MSTTDKIASLPTDWRDGIVIDLGDIERRLQEALAAVTPRDGGHEVYFGSDMNPDSAMNGEVMTEDGSVATPDDALQEALNLAVLALIAEQFPAEAT